MLHDYTCTPGPKPRLHTQPINAQRADHALAPVVYLHAQDPYFPSDVQTHLSHITPRVDFNPVSAPNPLDVNSVSQLGGDVYLTSNDDVTTVPEWIKGNKPDGSGKTNGVTAAVIVNDKGNGNVDAFYMYFYSYNWGGLVAGLKDLNFGMLTPFLVPSHPFA